MLPPATAILLWIASSAATIAAGAGIGVNWGTTMSHPLPPAAVVGALRANGIARVKLFDADPWTVSAFAGTGIEVTVAIPNDQLGRMSHYEEARRWVRRNVTAHGGSVLIRYVAVGNEPFLRSYNGTFTKVTFPALKNIQKALDEAGVGHQIKATVPLNADVYDSPADNPVPSAGDFRQDIQPIMVRMVRFLHANGAPFLVNIYPFLSLYDNKDFPLDYAFFDGAIARPVNDSGVNYTNVFDANYDTLVWALKKAGVPEMRIVVGEVGWPTDGDKNANRLLAQRFYEGFTRKMARNQGTPMRPGAIEAYLFALIDEDMKSITPGNFERHWGLFAYDGKPKFPMDLSDRGRYTYPLPVKGVAYLPEQWCVLDEKVTDLEALAASVSYACALGDCTATGYRSSCNGLDARGNASYAFNMYFQMQDQDVRACDFGGLAKISTRNASRNGCLFPLQIVSHGERAVTSLAVVMVVVVIAALMFG